MALDRAQAGVGFREATTFASKLATLKRNGCNLLVVGSDHEPTSSDACRRLLGCEGSEPRRRVVVAADTSTDRIRQRLPAASPGVGESDVLIDWQTPTRSAATATSAGTSPIEPVRVGADDVAQLGIEINEAIENLASGTEPGPGEIRLCFDSLTPLVARYDHETVFRFLHLVTSSVEHARGMGHYHLPVGRNTETARVLAPLFDAIIELRMNSGCSEQRWHVLDEDITTDWLPV